jgi:peroxiredoxin
MHLVRSGHSWSGNERNCVFLNVTPVDVERNAVPQFANASAVTGLDAPDDGRGLAIVDWDQDGDLDLWFRNRTAPRLRLMRNLTNEIAPDDQHITLRLVGTTCNRDAIGARAELDVSADGSSTKRIVRSVRAGDGFLSQSSTRLHFGIKQGAEVKRLIVGWPGGDREEFSGISVGASFEIKQGTGRAIRLEPRKPVRLAAKPYAPQPATAAARIVLPGRIACPPIDWKSDAQANAVPFSVGETATLMVFWTSSCPNCRRELSDIAEHRAAFNEKGLNVVAICLDGLDQPEGTPSDDNDDAKQFLQSIDFPFLAVHATRKAIERVRLFQNALFGKYPDFVVPLSFLVDSQGQVVCIYRGAFSHQTLLNDRALVEQDDTTLRILAPPLVGTWITEPATRTQIANFIAGRTVATDPELALRYYEWAIEVEQDVNRRKTLQDRIDQLKLIAAGRD